MKDVVTIIGASGRIGKDAVRGAAVLLAATGAGGLLAPSVSVAAPVQLRLAAPAQGAFVRAGHGVRVVFAGAPVGARLRFWRDGKRLSGLRARRVTVPTGGLRSGRHVVQVEAVRRGRVMASAGRSIVVGRRRADLLSAVSVRAARRALADDPISRRAYVPAPGVAVAGVRVRGTATRVRFRLNGRRVGYRLERVARRVHAVVLGADDGLRFGRNRLVAFAYRDDGGFDVVRQTLVRGRSLPIPAAGPDRRTSPGRAVRLDARMSKSARADRRLLFSWRVVRRPNGARVRLLRAQSVMPAFRPSAPGVYRLAVRVRERGAPAFTAASRAVEDAVTVVSAPAVPPAGMPLQVQMPTGPRTEAQIRYGIPAGAQSVACPSDEFCVLKLDRITLADQGAKTVGANSASGVAAEQAASGDADAIKQYLADVTDGTEPDSGSITVQLAPFYRRSTVWVGTTRVATNVEREVPSPPGWLSGSLQGVLQRDIGGGDTFFSADDAADAPNPRYTFRFTDYIPFHTRTETARGLTNTMKVGSASYPVSLPAAAIGGFEVLALDASGRPVQGTPAVFATTTRNPDADPTTLAAMGSLLDSARADDDLILVQSIGAPQWETYPGGGDNRQAWDQFAIDHLNPLGGNDDIFDALAQQSDAQGGSYALVAAPGDIPPAPPSVAPPPSGGAGLGETSAGAGSGGSLSGTLTHDEQSNLQPTVNDSFGPDAAGTAAGAGRLDLPALAFGPGGFTSPSDPGWRGWTPAQQNAFDDLVAGLKLPTAQLCPGLDAIRAVFCVTDPGVLTSTQNAVNAARPPSGAHGYTKADFAAVQKELSNEFDQVAVIRGWLGGFDTLLTNAGLTSLSAATVIQTQIDRALGTSQASDGSNLSGFLNLLAGAFAVGASVVGGPGGESISLVSNLMWTGSALAPGAGGDADPIFADVSWNAANAAAQLTGTFLASQDYFDRIGDLLVSDPYKLAEAAQNIAGSWAFDPTERTRQNLVASGVEQTLWGQILSAEYRVYFGPTSLSLNPRCDADYFETWTGNVHPFRNAPAYTTFTHEPLQGLYSWLGRNDEPVSTYGISPPDLTTVFTTPDLTKIDPSGAGAVPPWFLHRWFDYRPLPPNTEDGGCDRYDRPPPGND